MRVTLSAENINEVTNDPRVRPYVGWGDDYIDMGPVVRHSETVSCDFGDGYLIFHKQGAVWEIHTAFLPEAWGFRAYNCAREAIAHIFNRDDVHKIKAKPPVDNERVVRFCYLLGFTFCGTGKVRNPIPYEASIFTMTKEEFKCRQ